MWSNIWNYFSFSILLFLTDFQEIFLLLEIEDRLFGVHGAPVSQKPEIDSTTYLRKYGYLPRSDFETDQRRSDRENQEAIRRFQRMSNVSQTGTIDSETKKAMQKPRCGQPDIVPQEFKIGPSRWEKTTLTYRILSYTGDLDQNSVEQAIRDGFEIWSKVTPLNFRQISHGDADSMIAFRTLGHGDGSAFDGKGGILAHAFPPGEGRGGDIHFDDDELWTKNTREGVNLHIVASHEIGHALGLRHSEDQYSLMYPVYQGYSRNFSLSRDDIAGIQTIYGSKSHPRLLPDTSGHPLYRTSTSPRPPVRNDGPPNLCKVNLDAVSSIRGEIFAFHRKWFWWLKKDDTDPAVAHEITSFWRALPNSLDHIDAVVESKRGRIFFFIGKNYWEFDANQLVAGFPSSGRSIHDLGLPSSVERITAAFVWERTGKIYLFSQDNYWGLEGESQMRVGREYPRGMDMWMGSPFPIDAAFTHFDDRTYFIKGSQFWRLEKNTMYVERESPQRTRTLWPQCNGTEDTDSAAPASSILQLPALVLHANVVLYSHLLLFFNI